MARPMSVQEKHEKGQTYKQTNNIKYWKAAVSFKFNFKIYI